MKKSYLYSVFIFLAILGLVYQYIANNVFIRTILPHGANIRIVPASHQNNLNTAVIICPGGGYSSLAKWREGYFWIPFFHNLGYTVAILEYRMPHHDYKKPIIDGSEAIKYMRTQSPKWNFDKIGLMGFSSGGHLASTLMVSEDASFRPDFAILFYPVISMRKGLTHKWTHDNLLGENYTNHLEMQLSNELHVSDHTPPTYITFSSNDNIVNPKNSTSFYQSMITKFCSVTIKIYPTGGHGWGYSTSFPHHNQMVNDLRNWLKNQNAQHPVPQNTIFND